MRGFTPAKREEYLHHLRQGASRGGAAELIGLDRVSVLRFVNDNAKFQALVEDAELEAAEHVEEALYQAAISGSVTAAKTWLQLKGRMPATGAQQSAPSGTSEPEDPFAELDNVTSLDRRRK